MKWLEFIRVRSTSKLEKSIYKELSCQIVELSETPGLLEAGIYSELDIPGDLCVILSWDTEKPASGGSKPGLGLARVLKKSGITAYSVWIDHSDFIT